MDASIVYESLGREERKKNGVFFSGAAWASSIISSIPDGEWQRFIDPNVGIGDLLACAVQSLKVNRDFEFTIDDWRRSVAGGDISPRFTQMAWRRIVDEAARRVREAGGEVEGRQVDSAYAYSPFFNDDFLKTNLELRAGDCVLMNPPFQRMCSPSKGEAWGMGAKTAASFHLAKVIENSPRGVGIVALIPDVIRSGSSYEKFRQYVSEFVEITRFDPMGSFGGGADVDVAILAGTTRGARTSSFAAAETVESAGTVSEGFDVRVGPVVPHRTKQTGPLLPYFTARTAEDWECIDNAIFFEKFKARAENSPFVVIKRISSPSDRFRARAAIVHTGGDVYVENHLIICKPKRGGVKACKKLLRSLRDERTNAWLNDRIRCRHLTVSSVMEMPIWED